MYETAKRALRVRALPFRILCFVQQTHVGYAARTKKSFLRCGGRHGVRVSRVLALIGDGVKWPHLVGLQYFFTRGLGFWIWQGVQFCLWPFFHHKGHARWRVVFY